MLPVGSRVGDYEIEAELGAGGMATVYRVRHTLLDTRYALKVLDPRYRASAEARARFLDEARIQHKHLDHPNIVKVVNAVATAEHAALVMELIEGPSLDDIVAELRHRPDEVKRIFRGVLGGVGHAHAAGIVHRDLKPANVLLHGTGARRSPKVTDFGIAKLSAALAVPGKKSTQGDQRMGTLGYMSPEQIKRAKDVTERSDIFSLGVMLYELATGAMPFDGEHEYEVMDRVIHGRYPPPEERAPGLDPVIARVIRRALAVDPDERFGSCEEMAAALDGSDPDDEWETHEPTPLPAREVVTVAVPTVPVARGPSPAPRASLFRAFDVRSPSQRSIERMLVPVGAALVVWLLAMVFIGAVLGVVVGVVAVGAAVSVVVVRARQQFQAASTIMLRVEARADHRAPLARLMRDLGFEPTDETDHSSLHPIEPVAGGAESRTFQVAVPNHVAIDALHARCLRDLHGSDHYPPASRAEIDAPEGFAEFLTKLLWDNAVRGPDAHCLVRVLQWHEPH